MSTHSAETSPVPHMFERDRGAIRMCTCGWAYDHPCHDAHRVYEPRTPPGAGS